MTLERLTLARAVFRWALRRRYMRWGEHNALMRNIIWHERRILQCEGKEKFVSRRRANRVINRRRPHKADAAKYVTYRCEVCHMIHVATGGQVFVTSRKRILAKIRERERHELEVGYADV